MGGVPATRAMPRANCRKGVFWREATEGMAMSRPTTATQRFKEMPCSECGKSMQVGSNQRKKPRHFECGLKVQVENMKQLSEHSGPHYEKWRAAMARRFADG